MEQNLRKIENALPELEAKIKEFTGAEIKLKAQIATLYTMGNTQRITIFSDDLKNLITSGIAAPIFKYVYIKFWGGALSEKDMTICFFPKMEYEHYSGGNNSADYIWNSLRFDLNEEKWLFDESTLIYKS
ncbi:MAG: hypothetical protein LBJ63_05230 [Prevotellaceae bacterium]|jgi:hypothetical protein|nr:hypothetical protein [Prevotellaceae bacterium]